MGKPIKNHYDLDVYQIGSDLAMEVFAHSKSFPPEERYSLTDQIRRSSQSVCANLAEAWRKRRYEAHFISKLSDAEAEAAETQVWLEFSVKCGYLNREEARRIHLAYDEVLSMIVAMINAPEKWVLKPRG